MLLAGGLHITFYEGVDHLADFAADDVAGNADDPDPAEHHHGKRIGVIAAVDEEVGMGGANDLGNLVEVGAGFFDADDVVDLAEASDGVGVDVGDGATGDVVEDVGQGGGFGDRFEMLVKTVLRRPVVVRGDLEQSVNVAVGGETGEVLAFFGAVPAGAGDDARATAGGADGLAVEIGTLGLGEDGRLAGGAGRQESVVAGVNETLHEAAVSVEIDAVIVLEGGNHGGYESAKFKHCSVLPLPGCDCAIGGQRRYSRLGGLFRVGGPGHRGSVWAAADVDASLA